MLLEIFTASESMSSDPLSVILITGEKNPPHSKMKLEAFIDSKVFRENQRSSFTTARNLTANIRHPLGASKTHENRTIEARESCHVYTPLQSTALSLCIFLYQRDGGRGTSRQRLYMLLSQNAK